MQRVDEYRFYRLGAALERLRFLRPATPKSEGWFDCNSAREHLRQLLDDPVSLQVCRPVIQKVVKAIDSVMPEDPWDVPDGKMGFAAQEIQEGLKELDAVLEAECRTLDTYTVSRKGAYSTSHLIERAEFMIPEEIRTHLDEAVILDIREAGRSLVFDLPTAAGFHMLRAVELVMAGFWHKLIAGERVPTSWNQYIEQLKKARADPHITTMLDNIRDLYRNPIAHPELVLTHSQAMVPFGLGIAAIQQMVDRET